MEFKKYKTFLCDNFIDIFHTKEKALHNSFYKAENIFPFIPQR